MKYFITRMLDAALCACLVWGRGGFETFVFVLVASMILLTVLGLFVLTDEMAQKLKERGLAKRLVQYVVWLAYPSALVLSGHPYWAAAYSIIVIFFMTAVKTRNDKISGAA